jgi:hypothetical protein
MPNSIALRDSSVSPSLLTAIVITAIVNRSDAKGEIWVVGNMLQESATSSFGQLRMKENQDEEEAGLHFCGTAIVFRTCISG